MSVFTRDHWSRLYSANTPPHSKTADRRRVQYHVIMAKSRLPKKPRESPRYAAVAILRRLQEYGHVAYLAGGCVRDALLGREPKDYDVATDADPDRVRLLFKRSRFVGEAFGVVRVHMMGYDIEVATFRLEWGYTDGRRPGKVKFTDAQHDAQRRDFTINGLFEDPLAPDKDRRIIDYVGGRADLDRGVIRAIGNPDDRFGEDYLRMLRAVRFAARLGFTIEPTTAAAIAPLAANLEKISRERIGQEMQLMLSIPDAARRTAAVATLQQTQLDAPALDEEHLDAPIETVAALEDDVDYATVLAAWLGDRHGPEADPEPIIKRWRKALCLSNDDRDALAHVLKKAAAASEWSGIGKAARKRLLADAAWPQALALLRARAGHEDAVAAIDADSPALLAEGVAPAPWITGEDLIAMGRKPGPDFSRLLDAVYDAQLDGAVADREQALQWVEDQPSE